MLQEGICKATYDAGAHLRVPGAHLRVHAGINKGGVSTGLEP